MGVKLVRTISGVRKAVKKAREEGKKVGFVPTMGYLHEGHLSLMRKAKKETDFVVISIFVNPLQFGPKEDFHRYPRDLKRDKKLAEKVGVDLIFYPSEKEIYPSPFRTFVEVKELDEYLCGRSRPGHFRGVCTVVAKLFNIVQPDIAYFGQKDIQQARIIQQMVKDLNFPVKIKIMPIVREKDGLAMSSRNTYLSPSQRRSAVVLYRALQYGKERVQSNIPPKRVIEEMKKMISDEGGKVDYVEIVDWEDLKPVRRLTKGKRYIIAVAGWFGKSRLIDNEVVVL